MVYYGFDMVYCGLLLVWFTTYMVYYLYGVLLVWFLFGMIMGESWEIDGELASGND